MQTHTVQARDLAAALKSLQAASLKTRTASTVTVTLDHLLTLRGLCPGLRVVPSTRIGGGAALASAVGLAPLLKIAETLVGAVELSVIPGRFTPDDLLIRQNSYTAQLNGGDLHTVVEPAPSVPVPADALTIDAGVLADALAVVCPPGFLADVGLDRLSATSMRLTTTDGRRLISMVVTVDAPSDFGIVMPQSAVKALRVSTGGAVKIWAGLHSLHWCRGGELEAVDAKHGDFPPVQNVLKYWPGEPFASELSGVELRRVVKLAGARLLFRDLPDGKISVEGHESTVQLDSGQLADAHSAPVPVDARLLLPLLSKLDRVNVGFSPSMLTIDGGDGVVRLLARLLE